MFKKVTGKIMKHIYSEKKIKSLFITFQKRKYVVIQLPNRLLEMVNEENIKTKKICVLVKNGETIIFYQSAGPSIFAFRK